MQIPFGEWLPDQPEYLNPGATTLLTMFITHRQFLQTISFISKLFIKQYWCR